MGTEADTAYLVPLLKKRSISERHGRHSEILQSPTATLIPLFSSSEHTGCGYPGLLDRTNRSD